MGCTKIVFLLGLCCACKKENGPPRGGLPGASFLSCNMYSSIVEGLVWRVAEGLSSHTWRLMLVIAATQRTIGRQGDARISSAPVHGRWTGLWGLQSLIGSLNLKA